jgi:hypothetical protein
MKTPLKSLKLLSQPTHTSPRRAAAAINTPYQDRTSFLYVHNNQFPKLTFPPSQMFPLTLSLLSAGCGSNDKLATSELPSPQTKKTFKCIQHFSHSREIDNPHPSPDTFSRKESAHPKSRRSPPMPAGPPTLLNTKIAAATDLAATAATHITFESIGL